MITRDKKTIIIAEVNYKWEKDTSFKRKHVEDKEENCANGKYPKPES